MANVEDPIIRDRSIAFKPTIVHYLNYVVANFNPIVEEPGVYANQEYDNQTVDLVQKMRNDLRKEFLEL